MRRQKIVIIGLGYVGLPLALLANRKGYQTSGIDKDEAKLKLIANKISPFTDERVSLMLKHTKLTVTSAFSPVASADVILICVPTPVSENKTPDLSPVRAVATQVGKYLQKGQLVILESSVAPGDCESTLLPILEKESGYKAGKDFYLAHCPERIDPGNKKWSVGNLPRVVGGIDKKSTRLAAEFYRSLVSAQILEMASLKEAEAVKMVENSFRDLNIAFVNELAQFLPKIGVDTVNVLAGAKTKPFGFLAHYPGCGVGGHCISVDPYYLISAAQKVGFTPKLMETARQINNSMPHFAIKQLSGEMKIKGAKITVLGLSYKPDSNDMRESPALAIIEELKNQKAKVAIFDPYFPKLSTAKDLDQAVAGARGVILATAHKEFLLLSPRKLFQKGVRVFVDGRNCLDGKTFLAAGIKYRGIGTLN